MAQETPFLEMFGCCQTFSALCGGLDKAKVRNVIVSREDRTMEAYGAFAPKGRERS